MTLRQWGILLILFVVALIFATPLPATAQAYAGLPANAATYLPLLVQTQRSVWPNAPKPGHMGAQVQKESCITVKHSKCWNPRAELKTAREYGFGFGQTTVAYNADGSERFNVFKEMQSLDPILKTWAWQNRFDPTMQLRALVVKNRIGYERISGAATDIDHLAFSLAGYNGGMSGVLSDRRLCQATPGCDHRRWFGHTEKYSNKSRTPWKGYGKSAFDINREYPRVIIFQLTPMYVPYFVQQ